LFGVDVERLKHSDGGDMLFVEQTPLVDIRLVDEQSVWV